MSAPPDDPILTILGSGTCVPSLARSACSVLIRTRSTHILIDLGPGTMRRLLEAGSRPDDVAFIFLSHFHPDHTAEFVPFLFSSKYPRHRSRRRPVTLAAGNGFLAFYEGLRQVYGTWIELDPTVMELLELDSTAQKQRAFADFTVAFSPVKHRPESLAYRFTLDNGYTVVYSGDTDFCDTLIALAENADLLICESALPDHLKTDGHLTPSLAGTIATRAGVRRLMLTHFYPECDRVDTAEECRRTYSGPLILAEDLMEIALAAENE